MELYLQQRIQCDTSSSFEIMPAVGLTVCDFNKRQPSISWCVAQKWAKTASSWKARKTFFESSTMTCQHILCCVQDTAALPTRREESNNDGTATSVSTARYNRLLMSANPGTGAGYASSTSMPVSSACEMPGSERRFLRCQPYRYYCRFHPAFL